MAAEDVCKHVEKARDELTQIYSALELAIARIGDAEAAVENVRGELDGALAALAALDCHGPIDPPPPPHPPDLPKAEREVRVFSADDLAGMVASNPPRTRFVLAPGNYNRGVTGVVPKDGQQFVADGNVVIRGPGVGFVQCVPDSTAHDVAWQGIHFTHWGGRGGNAPKQSSGRLQSEVGIIQPNSKGWPRRAQDWLFLDLSFDDSRWMEGIKGGEGFEAHRCNFRELVLGYAGYGRLVRISNCAFETMNEVGAASHHHSGAIKLVGGRRNWAISDPNDPNYLFPPRENSHIWACTAKDLRSTRGLLWFDWDGRRCTIEDCIVEDCDYEGIVFEASAEMVARRITLKNCARKRGHPKWQGGAEWGGAVMLQNARDCILEDLEIHRGAEMRCAIGLSHHYRDRSNPPGHVGTNAGQTVGPFTGINNIVRNCRIEEGIPNLLFQGIDGAFPPGSAAVRSSNRIEGAERF